MSFFLKMKKVLGKLKSSEMILIFGSTSFLIFQHSKNALDLFFKEQLIQNVSDILAQDSEIMKVFGYDFQMKSKFFSILKSKIKFDGQFGETKFYIETPNGEFEVLVNASSQTYESIQNSSKSELNKLKFQIPEKSLEKLITEKMRDQNILKETKLDRSFKFWSIDFLSVKGSQGSFVRKPSLYLDTNKNQLNYETLSDVFENFKVTLTEKKGFDNSGNTDQPGKAKKREVPNEMPDGISDKRHKIPELLWFRRNDLLLEEKARVPNDCFE